MTGDRQSLYAATENLQCNQFSQNTIQDHPKIYSYTLQDNIKVHYNFSFL